MPNSKASKQRLSIDFNAAPVRSKTAGPSRPKYLVRLSEEQRREVANNRLKKPLGWTASSEAWEALDALSKGQSRSVNGKKVRLVAGHTVEDRLFEIVNTGRDQRFFCLEDAVEFVLYVDLVYKPEFASNRQASCFVCGNIVRRRGSALSALDHCYTCQVDMCSACLADHHDMHDADPAYRMRHPDDAGGSTEFFDLCAARDAVIAEHELRRGTGGKHE